jgi:ABC-type polar amino acid transport system ATPase subunit
MIEININGLGKFYGANRVFKNISFSIKKGESRMAAARQPYSGYWPDKRTTRKARFR